MVVPMRKAERGVRNRASGAKRQAIPFFEEYSVR